MGTSPGHCQGKSGELGTNGAARASELGWCRNWVVWSQHRWLKEWGRVVCVELRSERVVERRLGHEGPWSYGEKCSTFHLVCAGDVTIHCGGNEAFSHRTFQLRVCKICPTACLICRRLRSGPRDAASGAGHLFHEGPS